MGRPRKVSDHELLEALDGAKDPFVTVGDISSDLDVTGETIRDRLNQLVEKQWLKSKSVGRSAKVYWLTPDGYSMLQSMRSDADDRDENQ